MSAHLSFPPGFLWGTALSAHQTEGNNTESDWWAWEQSAAFSGREPSGQAVNHWELYETDFRLGRELGLSAQRLSIEWARIEPAADGWSAEALGHYRRVLGFLKQQGFRTFVTLHHFTNPRWLAQQGGWERPEVVGRFTGYVERVAGALGELVDFWNPINEPTVYTAYAYFYGLWPPQAHSAVRARRVFRNLMRAHRAAYHLLHRKFAGARVGTAHHVVAFEPARGRWLDCRLAAAAGWFHNEWFLQAVRDTLDFIGVNYYFRKRVGVRAGAWRQGFCDFFPAQGPQNDLGWEIYPEGLYHQLVRLKRFGLPVYITENGLADARDTRRPGFIRAHLRQVLRALAEGVEVRGYFHWSLLDNYEWHLGFAPRFGLIEVDYRTFERRLRPSARVYSAIVRANALPAETL